MTANNIPRYKLVIILANIPYHFPMQPYPSTFHIGTRPQTTNHILYRSATRDLDFVILLVKCNLVFQRLCQNAPYHSASTKFKYCTVGLKTKM